VILEARRNTTMNDDIIAYDKAKWHHEGDYPTDLPKKALRGIEWVNLRV
jgi:hypothetical protein